MSRETCDLCKIKEKHNQAVSWCLQCEESLCVDCAQNHNLPKLFRHHKLVKIDDAPNFSKPPNVCSQHGNFELDYYCFDHETLSCKECLICNHKSCEKILLVDHASSDIQQTNPFNERTDQINLIQNTLQTMLTNRTKNVEDIEREIQEIKEKTSATKESFIKHLESLEQQVFSALDKAKDLHLQKIKEVIKDTKTNIASIEEMSTAFEWTKKHGSDKQMFMLIHTSHTDISDIEDKVEKLTSNVVSISFTASKNKITAEQLSIGSFEVRETPQNIAFQAKRLHQCQFLAPCPVQTDLLENVSYTAMCTSNSLDIQWYTFSTDDSIITYSVQYRDGETMHECIQTKQPRVKLLHLQPNTKYQIVIGAERKNRDRYTLLHSIISTLYPTVIEEILKCTNISGDSQSEAEFTLEDTNPKTYSLKLTKEGIIAESKKVRKSTMGNADIEVKFTLEGTNPKIYCLKPIKEEYIADSEKVRKCTMISEISKTSESLQNQKTIIVMGASGSGKTTFIDAMFNYMIGVSHESNHRFKIVNLTESERKKLGHQYESQTEGVTWYSIPVLEGPNMNGIINIIDTPGFEDTRGENYDEEISKMIEILFSKGEGIESLDAICLVEKLSVNRLTQRQEYIFKSVTKIFGKDIADNIFACLTFDDGGEAHVLKAFEQAGMSYLDKVHFRFNNSNIFGGIQDVEVWSKRKQSFEDFFKQLGKVQKKSLRTTKEVLNSRSSLQMQLLSIQQNLRNQVQNISNVEKARSIIQDCQMDIEEYKDFTFTVQTTKKRKRENKLHCLNCPKCEITCHNNFRNWSKYMCEIIYWNGYCKICGCSSSEHIGEQIEYYEVFEEEKSTLKDIYEKHQTALHKKLDQTDLLELEENSLRKSFQDLAELFCKIQNLIEQLNKIALTPATFSLEYYITDLIKIEKFSNEPGSEKRIALFQNISEVIKKTDEKNSIFNNLCEAFKIPPSSPNNEKSLEGTFV
ncbi:unnamed protein product [Mytilus coruscus]|uniref:Fibronectin type-III domain-containing protein n=1 Tax=Mytilus coruscus TaxID=42192 RepID=A0A6J8DM75_MYTCO|nr:unnamed protein product [Mytilus coruscus]